MYTVYRLENVVTKKNYIGMTSRNPKRRWSSGYNGKMGDAIKQFPFDLCWKKYIEFQTPNKEQALELESELMKWYDSVENGYNSSTYSNYGFTEETKKKIRENTPSKSVLQFSKDGKFLAEYPSIMEASRQTGCHHQSICSCCKGNLKTCGRYIWKYKKI